MAWLGFKPRSPGSNVNRLNYIGMSVCSGSFPPNCPALTCSDYGYPMEITPSQGRDHTAAYHPYFFQTCFSVSSSCVAFGEGQALSVCYSLPVHGYQNGRGWCQGCKVVTSYWGSEPLYSYAPRDTGPRWEAGAVALQLGRWEGQQVFRKCPEIHLTLCDAHQPRDSQVPSVRLPPAR